MQKTHPLYKNYNITVTGKVINNLTGKVREPSVNTYGYKVVTLYDTYLKPKQFFIHRLVYEMFVGDIGDGMTIDHVDGNKFNNRPSNLEQVSASENTSRYYSRLPEIDNDVSQHLPKRCTTNSNSRLTLETVKNLILDIRAGMSNNDAGNKYGVHPRYVSLIRHKRRWIYAWNDLGLGSATTNLSGSKAK